jgi:hypothetical protein
MYDNNFAIVTPYYREPIDVVERAISSVESQMQIDLSIKHYLVADGFPLEFKSKKIIHLTLPSCHSDCGDTPRVMGATLAVRQGCRGLMFLDADNVLYPSHVELAYKAHQQTGCNIVITRRDMLSAAGDKLAYPDEDRRLEHVDTGCFVFFGEAVYDALEWVKIPRQYSVVGDRYLWQMIKAKRRQVTVIDTPTVGYKCLWKANYISSNVDPPMEAKNLDLSRYRSFNESLTAEERLVLNQRLFL